MGEQELLYEILDQVVPVGEVKTWLDKTFEVRCCSVPPEGGTAADCLSPSTSDSLLRLNLPRFARKGFGARYPGGGSGPGVLQ